jgi:hypothetical protein
MKSDQEPLVAKLRQDHEYMIELMEEIRRLCIRGESSENCSACPVSQRVVCGSNIEQAIRAFIEITLRHNLIESACMDRHVPTAHRVAHNLAHIEIAEQLEAIRRAFKASGNGAIAVSDISALLDAQVAHFADYDTPLENYLLAA